MTEEAETDERESRLLRLIQRLDIEDSSRQKLHDAIDQYGQATYGRGYLAGAESAR